ncbi:MAG: polyprenyl synthetase family protein [Deltaproteobacteria bacterium]|nr:polyprenyl synthetase family protein [Deltaproteobacteria bacterium]
MLDKLYITIKSELRQVEDVLATHLHSDLPVVNDVAQYVIKNGGKRIRPALFLLCTRMLGEQSEARPRLAASFEILHTASLLHDDVVDDAHLRRGKPSAKAKWGNQVSVLVGDVLWCKATALLVEYGNQKLLDLVVRAISQLSEGELLEISRQNDITMDQEGYLKIVRNKTAALFSAATEGAGIMANVSEQFLTALKRYGMDLGVAFQLADDAMDYVSDEALFGKKAGGDLREGKLTYPLIMALGKTTPVETTIIREALIADHLTDDQFQSVLGILKKHRTLDATLDLARDFADKAKSHLTIFKPSIEREALAAVADYAVDRRD